MSPSLNFTNVSLAEVPMEDVELDRQPVVLVVDDEPAVADTVSLILSRAGYRIAKAYSGAAGLALAIEQRPDLLLSDVAMPGMGGVELALAVMAAVPGCKALLLSGHANHASLDDAELAGHNLPLLRKPVHPTKLLERIAHYMAEPPSTLLQNA